MYYVNTEISKIIIYMYLEMIEVVRDFMHCLFTVKQILLKDLIYTKGYYFFFKTFKVIELA